mmetsp:Transcript_30342/g.93655  ORF Transcript_30342/g.93655 Transcript_30342/m.93655 type:complete len:349 (-) Transcript_30342:148-1194(-)
MLQDDVGRDVRHGVARRVAGVREVPLHVREPVLAALQPVLAAVRVVGALVAAAGAVVARLRLLIHQRKRRPRRRRLLVRDVPLGRVVVPARRAVPALLLRRDDRRRRREGLCLLVQLIREHLRLRAELRRELGLRRALARERLRLRVERGGQHRGAARAHGAGARRVETVRRPLLLLLLLALARTGLRSISWQVRAAAQHRGERRGCVAARCADARGRRSGMPGVVAAGRPAERVRRAVLRGGDGGDGVGEEVLVSTVARERRRLVDVGLLAAGLPHERVAAAPLDRGGRLHVARGADEAWLEHRLLPAAVAENEVARLALDRQPSLVPVRHRSQKREPTRRRLEGSR